MIAIIVASVPEFVNLRVSIEGVLSVINLASFVWPSVGALYAVPISACDFIALIILGAACP